MITSGSAHCTQNDQSNSGTHRHGAIRDKKPHKASNLFTLPSKIIASWKVIRLIIVNRASFAALPASPGSRTSFVDTQPERDSVVALQALHTAVSENHLGTLR